MHLKTYKLEIYRIFTDCFFRKNYVRIRVKFGQVTVKPDIVEGLKLILDRFSPPQSTTIKLP
jgi:hypothetical protein